MTSRWDARKIVTGTMFAGIGLAAIVLSARLDIGTPRRLGPGGFPLLLGGILALLGFAHFLSAARPARQDIVPEAWAGKAVLLIPLSAVAFATVINHLGLVPAIIACVFVGGLANARVRWLELAILSIALAAFGAGLFVYGLGLPFTLLEIR